MNREDHLALLKDESRSVIERLRSAVLLELDYWSDPNKSPPNMAREEFERLLIYIPLNTSIQWKKRTSSSGTHGKTGEESVFNTEFEIIRGRYKYIYYLKGYFFDKDNLKGVCVQSFRLEKKLSRNILRSVK